MREIDMARARLPRRRASLQHVASAIAVCRAEREPMRRFALLNRLHSDLVVAKRPAMTEDEHVAARAVVLEEIDRTAEAMGRSDKALRKALHPVARVHDEMR